MDEEAASRDHVGSLERGLAVMEILARHPAGMTLTEMAEEAGLTRAGARRFLLTLVATGYATQSGRRVLAVAAPADRRPHLARRRLAVDLRRAHHARGRGAAERGLLGGHPVGRGCRLCRPHSRPPHPQRVARCRHQAAGLLHLDGTDPAFRPDAQRIGRISSARRRSRDGRRRRSPTGSCWPRPSARRRRTALPSSTRSWNSACARSPCRSATAPERTVAAINVSTQSARFSVAEMEREILPALLEARQRIEDFFVV